MHLIRLIHLKFICIYQPHRFCLSFFEVDGLTLIVIWGYML